MIIDKKTKSKILEEYSKNKYLMSDRSGSKNTNFKSKFLRLSSTRNQHLITRQEQDYLRTKTVTFFGLSVGSHAAITWGMMIKPLSIKISDPDRISCSNLNRINASMNDVGKLKTAFTYGEIIRTSPYTKIIKTNSTNKDSVLSFINGKPQADLIFDAVDDLKTKYLLRNIAKKLKIPLLMCTDVGNNVIVDIERYDSQPSTLPFHGWVKNYSYEQLENIDEKRIRELAISIVGKKFNSKRMLKSLNEIGKTIETWPQLGSTASMAGGIAAGTIKEIFINKNIKSGRYLVSLDQSLNKSLTN